jgi:hypothetical protein
MQYRIKSEEWFRQYNVEDQQGSFFVPTGLNMDGRRKTFNTLMFDSCNNIIDTEVLLDNHKTPYIVVNNDIGTWRFYEGWFEEAYPIKKLQLKRTPIGFQLCNIK